MMSMENLKLIFPISTKQLHTETLHYTNQQLTQLKREAQWQRYPRRTQWVISFRPCLNDSFPIAFSRIV